MEYENVLPRGRCPLAVTRDWGWVGDEPPPPPLDLSGPISGSNTGEIRGGLYQACNKLLTICNNIVGIIRLVARLFQQV